jgi:hypothetical protein
MKRERSHMACKRFDCRNRTQNGAVVFDGAETVLPHRRDSLCISRNGERMR